MLPLSIIDPDELLDELPPDELLPDELPPLDELLDELLPLSEDELHPGPAETTANPARLTTIADQATLFMCLSQSNAAGRSGRAGKTRLRRRVQRNARTARISDEL
jgi:hypothetical protein